MTTPSAHPEEGRRPVSKDHNSTDDRLRLLCERYERLDEEHKGIGDDKRDVVGEAKAVGYDGKMFREMLRLRKMSRDDRDEFEALRETYKCALGIG